MNRIIFTPTKDSNAPDDNPRPSISKGTRYFHATSTSIGSRALYYLARCRSATTALPTATVRNDRSGIGAEDVSAVDIVAIAAAAGAAEPRCYIPCGVLVGVLTVAVVVVGASSLGLGLAMVPCSFPMVAVAAAADFAARFSQQPYTAGARAAAATGAAAADQEYGNHMRRQFFRRCDLPSSRDFQDSEYFRHTNSCRASPTTMCVERTFDPYFNTDILHPSVR